MSKTPLNKKYLELDNIRVYHDKKTNTLQIISKDSDLKGKPFQISLQNGSPSENTLRELLTSKGVIDQDLSDSYFIPKYVSAGRFTVGTPSKGKTIRLFDKWNYIPLGVTYESIKLYVNVEEATHTIVAGGAGTGKTVLLNSIARHCLNHTNDWDLYVATPYPKEHSHLYDAKQVNVAFTNKDLYSMLTEVHNTMRKRLIAMTEQETTTYRKLSSDNKPIMLIIDGLLEFLSPYGVQNSEQTEMFAEINMAFKNILTFGKTAGVHIVATNQSAKFNDKDILSLFATRIAMGQINTVTAETLFGGYIPRQVPRVSGRGIITSTSLAAEGGKLSGDVLEFQVPIYDKNPGC